MDSYYKPLFDILTCNRRHYRHSPGLLFILCVTWIFFSTTPTAVAQEHATLRLNDGDIYQGHIVDHSNDGILNRHEPDALVWNCDAFLEPLSIPWAMVDSISTNHTHAKASDPNITDLYVIEFENGESISGGIERFDGQIIQVSSNRYGSTQIALEQIRAILKVRHSAIEGVGRLSPNEWQQVLPVKKPGVPDTWNSKAGSIETSIAGSTVSQMASLPTLAAIDIDVEWTHSNPNWTLAIGNNLPKLELRVRKLEQREELSVTLLFEEEKFADIATMLLPSPNIDSLRLKILCDLEEGRFALQQNGRTIGEIYSRSNPGAEPSKFDNRVRFQLTNDSPGGMILRELKVSRSPFSMARSNKKADDIGVLNGLGIEERFAKVLLNSGKTWIGSLRKAEGEGSNLLLTPKDEPTVEIALKDIERIELNPRSSQPSASLESEEMSEPQQEFCVLQTTSGERFSGESLSQSSGILTLICNSLATPIRVPAKEVASVQFIRNSNAVAPESGTHMKLVCEDAHSNGYLVPLETQDDPSQSSGWTWRPAGLTKAFRLNPKVNGTILAIRTETDVKPGNDQRSASSSRIETYGRSLLAGEPAIFLTNGDSLPGELTGLANKTLSFKSELFGDATLSETNVRGIRQLVYAGSERLDPTSIKKLLTIPRMSRQSPPSHLVVARDGDMIRGQVTFVDQDMLRIVVREEEREIWMKNVAEIIWLEPAPAMKKTENEQTDAPVKIETQRSPQPSDAGTRTVADQQNLPFDASSACQIVTRQGSVISLVPKRIEKFSLVGVHPLLGECTVRMDETVQILFGAEIEKTRSTSRFVKWKLRHAVDPKFVTEEADAESGEASEMIGKPAIDFELKSLDGRTIKLSDLRGQVVVLDFWASWCGPCRKSLPVIQGIADDFENDPFSFYAINVDEEPNVVRGSAIVLGIENNCLLDPKGIVSKDYGASAIPYTVVIDQRGIVRRVFVGANDQAFKTLRESISTYLQSSPL